MLHINASCLEFQAILDKNFQWVCSPKFACRICEIPPVRSQGRSKS